VTVAGGRVAGGSIASGQASTGRVANEPSETPDPGVATLLVMAPASTLGAGSDVPSYWAARSGRALSTYWGAYAPLGPADYLWWAHEGSLDPGLWVAALDGLTGHEVALPSGNVTAPDVASATAAVVDAIDGWSAEADGDGVEISGPEAVTVGPGWNDADPGDLVGMRSITVADAPIEGPISTVLAQHLPDPGLPLPIVAVDVFIGTDADPADRWRVALWTGASSTTPAGETLLADLGQVPAAQIVSRQWARVPMPAGVVVTADQPLWLSLKSELGLTDVGGRLTGDPLIGQWVAQPLQQDDGGIDPDATVAWPATWPGTTSDQNPFVCGARLVVARSVHDGSHHSEADPAIFGTHVAPGDLGSTIDLNSHLLMVAPAPPFLGMVIGGEGWAVGAVRGTQPRLGVMTGGSAVEPVDPDGATLLVDGGRLTGATTTAWEDRTHAPVPWTAGVATAWVAKCNDDAGGTNIAFAQDPDQANASPPETPMDWLPAATSPGPTGSEYEIFPADSAYNDTDPTATFTTPFVADPDDARPRNVPGARILWWIPGITATPL
jgi:hypothetical protein